MVVGDDAQSIYRFRGADIRNIRCFPDQFAPRAKTTTLARNYRSTKPILKACNEVMSLASEGFRKELRSDRRSSQKPFLTTVSDDAAQTKHVVEQLLRARDEGIPLIEQATLFRNSLESAGMEAELTRRGIPFVKYGGSKFLEGAHVKDVLSMLRWCENPFDRVAGFRALRLLPGIGASTAASILAQAGKPLQKAELRATIAVPAAKLDWPKFIELIHQLRAGHLGWPEELRRLRRWYKPYFERQYDDIKTRSRDLDLLEGIAADYGARADFLANLTLDPPDEIAGPGAKSADDYTVLSTIHSAKGRQWKIVRILNVVEGYIPSKRAQSSEEVEEERRLLYVAMTRARDELDLIAPYHAGSRLRRQPAYTPRSNFIPRSIERAFDVRTAPVMRPAVKKRRNK